MALSDQLDDRRSRCRQQLARLRTLAQARAGAGLSGEDSTEIRDATNAVIADVAAISQTALHADGQREPNVETFLWVRIARLAAEADLAVDAARTRDVAGVRGHLRQFDRLTSAILPYDDLHSGLASGV